MDLLLHIGCEKTGTTSVQDWLHENAKTLAEHGVVYSKILGRPNNRRIALYGLEPGRKDDGLWAMEELENKEQHVAAQARIAGELTAEISAAREAGARIFVISNEHCHSRMDTEASVRRIHDLLEPQFAAMRVVAFVRPQVDVCLSLASTLARMGHEVSRSRFDAQLKPTATYFNMRDLLARWAGVFGRERMVALAFRKQPDTVRCLEELLGVGELALPRVKSSNEALDFRVIAMTNAMGLKAHEGVGMNQYRRFFVNELPVLERLTLDEATARRLQQRFDASNAEMCTEWPQIEPQYMEPDWRRYPAEGNIDRLDDFEEYGVFVRAMVERFNEEMWLLKARHFSMTAERDALKDNEDMALRNLDRAIDAAELAGRSAALAPRVETMVQSLQARKQRMQRRIKRKVMAE